MSDTSGRGGEEVNMQTGATQPVTLPRRYPAAPLVGVAAAVFNDAGEVLLVKRGRPPRQGHWGLPGGLLDLGERLADGVRREIMEECGIEVEIGGLVTVFEPIMRDEDGRVEYHFVVIDYWAVYIGGEASASDDADDLAWVAQSEWAEYNLAAETLAVVEQAHRHWLTRS